MLLRVVVMASGIALGSLPSLSPRLAAAAPEIPRAQPWAGPSREWEAHLRRFFRHYRSVTVTHWPAAGRPACAELRLDPWRLEASLAPSNSQIFTGLELRVRRLAPGLAAYPILRRARRGERHPFGDRMHPCFIVDKRGHLIAQVGPYLVEALIPCSSGGLATYEAADFVALLESWSAARGEKPPGELVFSRCGRMELDFVRAEELRREGRKRRVFWNQPYPEVRDAARRGRPR